MALELRCQHRLTATTGTEHDHGNVVVQTNIFLTSSEVFLSDMRVNIRQDSMIEVTSSDDRQLHREVETPVGVFCRRRTIRTNDTSWPLHF